jgi:hypothetical protein
MERNPAATGSFFPQIKISWTPLRGWLSAFPTRSAAMP